MGFCYNKNKGINDSINNKGKKKTEIDTGHPLISIDVNLFNVIKSVCKIITNKRIGTGFLIKLY